MMKEEHQIAYMTKDDLPIYKVSTGDVEEFWKMGRNCKNLKLPSDEAQRIIDEYDTTVYQRDEFWEGYLN